MLNKHYLILTYNKCISNKVFGYNLDIKAKKY